MARKSAPGPDGPQKRKPAKKAAPKRAPAAKKSQKRGSSAAEHRVHTPKDAGSIPAPASKKPAPVAQPAEQPPRKGKVAGSTPARGPKARAQTPPGTPTADKLLAARPARDPRAEAPLTMAEEAFVTEYLRNNGNGTFTDRSAEIGLTTRVFNTQAAAFADRNGDGKIDLKDIQSAVDLGSAADSIKNGLGGLFGKK